MLTRREHGAAWRTVAAGASTMNDSTASMVEAASPDRLSIGRLMLLTAGVAVGLALCMPLPEKNPGWDYWTVVYNGLLCGLALPAPLICLPRAWRKQPIGTGGLFALVAGLAVLGMTPALVIESLARHATPPSNDTDALACMYYLMPLMGLWHFVAALATGSIARLFKRQTAWSERYGLVLAALWSPLGAWLMVLVYRDVLKP
jgi:hypothetical protein